MKIGRLLLPEDDEEIDRLSELTEKILKGMKDQKKSGYW